MTTSEVTETAHLDTGGARLPSPPRWRRARVAWVALGGLLVSATALGIGAALDKPPTLMAPSDYLAKRAMIEAESRDALELCLVHVSAELGLCRARVQADERIRRAMLEAQYLGTAEAAESAERAQTDALYEVAVAKCDAREGKARLRCLKLANAEREKSPAAPLANQAPASLTERPLDASPLGS